MRFLLQLTQIEKDKILEFAELLEKFGIEYDFVFPRNDKIFYENGDVYIFNENETYFACGSYALTRNVYKIRKEAVFSLEEYNFEKLMTIFGKDNFVNHDALICHSSEIDWSKNWFVRPFYDDKSFNGGLFSKEFFKFNGEVVIAQPKSIEKEFRFFVIDKKIISSSLYKINGKIVTSDIIDTDISDFANDMVKKFDFPGYVIDIASVSGVPKIMELNCLNASGFYDINLYKFIDAILNFYEKNDLNISFSKHI